MAKYRKKPVVIEAVQWTGDTKPEIEEFFKNFQGWWFDGVGSIAIETLEGIMRANPGDWIIKGINGEFYPCKNDIFEKTYEPA